MDTPEEFFKSLPREDVQLLALREVLYEGSWEELVADLKARKEGKPYVYKLDSRINEDLQRIERLRTYESAHQVNLGKFISLEALSGGQSDER